MRLSRQVAIGLVLLTVGTLAMTARGSQRAADKKPSNTREMRCVIKATAELKRIQADMAKAGRDAPQVARLQQAIQMLEQCTNRCMDVTSGPFDPGVRFIMLPGTEEKTVADRIAAKQSDLREASRRIAETQRMMTGSKTFDPELSRIEWAARRCEQAEARIRDLKTRLAGLQPCTLTVIGAIE